MCDQMRRIEARGRDEGRAEGLAEGRAEGRAESEAKTARNLKNLGMGIEEIARVLETDAKRVEELLYSVNDNILYS